MVSLKTQSEVLRIKKMFAQTKALYCYLNITSNNDTNLNFTSKDKIINELNITPKQFEQGISVLHTYGYLKTTTAKNPLNDKEQNAYLLVDKWSN